MATAMVWRSVSGDFRVTVEAVSVTGVATLVSFTRTPKFWPEGTTADGERWVLSSQLHKAVTRVEATASKIKNRKLEEASDAELVTSVNESLRKAPRKRVAKAASITPEFTSF